jgi:glycosyltransferase involved in cell wall biosynthesis
MASTRSMLDALTRLYAPIPRLLQCRNASRFPEYRTVPHGRDAACFQPLAKRDEVLCVSAPGEEAQNLLMLKRVAEDLPWPVLLAGRDDFVDGAPLHVLGTLGETERAARMGSAAIFASPTRYEPFGFTVLEAALAGCALVLGDIPSLRETWGEAAIFAPPDDAQAFGVALRLLIEDGGLRDEMAGRARKVALQLTPEQMAEGVFEGYRSLIAPRLAPAEVIAEG